MRGLTELGDPRHQDRRGLQVPVGVRDVRVAEIGAEREEVTRDRIRIGTALFQ
jgi:hypothetical protein